MNAFRSRAPILYQGGTPFIRDLEKTEENSNGVVVNKETLVILTPSDYHKKHPVPTEEYSLTDEIEAGVNLREIPCGHLLDSEDNLDYDINDSAEELVLEQLNKDVTNE